MGSAIAIALVALLSAIPSRRVELADPAGDDHGPGGYVYPSDTLVYRRGSFDLRALEIAVEGDTIVFSVTLGQTIRAPGSVKRTNAAAITLQNNVYLQNVDIYIDRDPTPGAGFTEAIPGRNVEIAADNAWEAAVVITPQPSSTRSMLSDWAPARHVVFPDNVTAVGAKLVARVDLVALGGLPEPEWGYQVLVTGAIWEASFDVVRRYVDERSINAFTMPVQTLPEAQAFGGGEVERVHPMVLDLLAPPGRTQEAILSGYDKAAKRVAVIPLVYPNPEAWSRARSKARPLVLAPVVAEPPAPASIDLEVRDVQGNTLVLKLGGGEAIEAYRLGQIFDASGRPLCRVVVTSVHGTFAMATAVDCGPGLAPGAIARFEKTAPKE